MKSSYKFAFSFDFMSLNFKTNILKKIILLNNGIY